MYGNIDESHTWVQRNVKIHTLSIYIQLKNRQTSYSFKDVFMDGKTLKKNRDYDYRQNQDDDTWIIRDHQSEIENCNQE